MHCPYCNANNPDTAALCLSCGHALPAAQAHKAASGAAPNYAFPYQARPENARIVGKREFRVQGGVPPAVGDSHLGRIGRGEVGASAPASAREPLPTGAPPAPPAPAAPEAHAAAAQQTTAAFGAEAARAAAAMPPYRADAGLGRQTPYFDETAFGTGEYRPPSPPWHEYDSAPRSRGTWAQAALWLFIFVLGAGSGAAALWWNKNAEGLQQALAAKLADPKAPEQAIAPEAALGTPPGELPYDGLASAVPPAPAAPAVAPNSVPASVTATAVVPNNVPQNLSNNVPAMAAAQAGNRSAERSTAMAAAPASVAVPVPAQPQPEQKLAQKSDQAPDLSPAYTVATNAPPVPPTANTAELVTAAQPVAASRVTAAPPAVETQNAMPPATAKAGKKRWQAQSAGGSKADGGEVAVGSRSTRTAKGSSSFSSGASAGSGSSGYGASSSPRTLTPLMIAQCESMSDRSERILCKREVCNGKWGSNGCPANAPDGPAPG